MQRNSLETYKHIYDMNQYQQAMEIKDLHESPRIVGPMTNYIFKKMQPMHQFLDLVLGNSKSYLRMYDTKGEE